MEDQLPGSINNFELSIAAEPMHVEGISKLDQEIDFAKRIPGPNRVLIDKGYLDQKLYKIE